MVYIVSAILFFANIIGNNYSHYLTSVLAMVTIKLSMVDAKFSPFLVIEVQF